ncbi:hypothetical protein HPB47_018919 [Ixodes persulcatus]|uniref:Uncharacterized protein n=1 Tax=Ixodes persulcatus TaxID=34615 RepID=A0AC60QLR9_IXOPE|nr:hypothetical protein HPB47_018919 [Ixodes persulcatus]
MGCCNWGEMAVRFAEVRDFVEAGWAGEQRAMGNLARQFDRCMKEPQEHDGAVAHWGPLGSKHQASRSLTRSYLGGGYQFTCQGINSKQRQDHDGVLELCWWYLWVRIGDFRTPCSSCSAEGLHVSFLHVTHHSLGSSPAGTVWRTVLTDTSL